MADSQTENGMPLHETEPLYERRGNNPPRLIGYRCTGCKALLTPSGNWSSASKTVQTNRGFEGRSLPNKSHARRKKAAGWFSTNETPERQAYENS